MSSDNQKHRKDSAFEAGGNKSERWSDMGVMRIGVRETVSSIKDWNSLVGHTFAGAGVDAESDRFNGRLTAWDLDELRMVDVEAEPSHVKRAAFATRITARNSVLLHLQVQGVSLNGQGGRLVELGPGQSMLCAADEPYEVDFRTPYRMFVLELGLARIFANFPDFDLARICGRPLEASRSRVLLSYLSGACAEQAALQKDDALRAHVQRTAIDLALDAIALLCAQPNNPAARIRHEVVAHIRANLADPDLRSASIANALKVSQRTVQTVFERMSTTAGAFIAEQRLRDAAILLRREPRTITDIAFAVGFNDSAHFSRSFTRQFGVAPRVYRARSYGT
jgi:AraC-like DNA-binding protein